MPGIDEEVQRIELGEAWEDTDEAIRVEVQRPLDKVIPVRLPSAKWEELRKRGT